MISKNIKPFNIAFIVIASPLCGKKKKQNSMNGVVLASDIELCGLSEDAVSGLKGQEMLVSNSAVYQTASSCI